MRHARAADPLLDSLRAVEIFFVCFCVGVQHVWRILCCVRSSRAMYVQSYRRADMLQPTRGEARVWYIDHVLSFVFASLSRTDVDPDRFGLHGCVPWSVMPRHQRFVRAW